MPSLGLEPLDETVELVDAIRAGTVRSTVSGGGGEPPAVLDPRRPRSRWTIGNLASACSCPPRRGSALSRAKDRAEFQHLIESELSPSLEVLRLIGQGSMADVFLAREPHLKRLVAVKILSPHHYSDPRARKRFEREAQAAARINHPHVCTVHRVGSLSDGTPFLVSPFVKGTTLAQRLKAEGRLNPTEVRRVLREVASALAAAHKLGIIHRDVRPDNVLRADENGRHSLCDFGIAGVLETGEESGAKITQTGEMLGHPAYISPEQMDGRPLTDRADIYSLGVLAHQLLTGHPPPPRDDPRRDSGKKGATAALALEPLADYLGDTDQDLVELIGRCLATDPAHRPSAGDVERKLSTRSGEPAMSKAERVMEVNLGNLIFRKRLPQILGGYLAAAWLAVESVEFFQTRGIRTRCAFPVDPDVRALRFCSRVDSRLVSRREGAADDAQGGEVAVVDPRGWVGCDCGVDDGPPLIPPGPPPLSQAEARLELSEGEAYFRGLLPPQFTRSSNSPSRSRSRSDITSGKGEERRSLTALGDSDSRKWRSLGRG